MPPLTLSCPKSSKSWEELINNLAMLNNHGQTLLEVDIFFAYAFSTSAPTSSSPPPLLLQSLPLPPQPPSSIPPPSPAPALPPLAHPFLDTPPRLLQFRVLFLLQLLHFFLPPTHHS